jgi:hypothetical protein
MPKHNAQGCIVDVEGKDFSFLIPALYLDELSAS